jgi:hypothetical protein
MKIFSKISIILLFFILNVSRSRERYLDANIKTQIRIIKCTTKLLVEYRAEVNFGGSCGDILKQWSRHTYLISW